MPPLFSISTNRLHLTWSGPPAPPDPTAPAGFLRVYALRGVSVLVERDGKTVQPEAPLRLTEQTVYRVFLRSRNGASLALRHDDPLATREFVTDEDGTIISGIVNFEGQVGRSRFVVLADGEEEVAFEVGVFPIKASFAETEAMRADLDETLAGLALEYLRATTMSAQTAAQAPRRATWLTLLRRTLPELEDALRRVAARPYGDLLRESRLVRAERVRRLDATVRRAVLRGQGNGEWIVSDSGEAVRSVLPERRAAVTLDTSEHRWLRMRLEGARVAVAAAQRDEAELPRSARRRRVLADLSGAEHRLASLVRLPPLAAANSPHSSPAITQRLLTAPGYAEAYRTCQRLSLGVTLAEGPVPHATRDLHLLYEMWCYLVVLQRIARLLRQPIPIHGFFRTEHRGIRMLLRRGREHAVTLESGARSVQVIYNPRFAARSGLLSQRPDLLLSISTRNETRHYVLDAKYRREDTLGYVRRFGAPGPPEDALGDLHRYRDAIRDERGRRIVEQAVALYPYRAGETFDESRLWTAIGRVGVGAIPLVPGAEAYLDRWLADVLSRET